MRVSGNERPEFNDTPPPLLHPLVNLWILERAATAFQWADKGQHRRFFAVHLICAVDAGNIPKCVAACIVLYCQVFALQSTAAVGNRLHVADLRERNTFTRHQKGKMRICVMK